MDLLDLPSNFSFNSSSSTNNNNKIVLLCSWTNASDVHLKKYVSWWQSRDYDILTIKTSSTDRLIPPLTIKRNNGGLIRFFTPTTTQTAHNSNRNYNQIVFHTFSVGNIVAFEFIQYLLDQQNQNDEKGNENISCRRILSSITALVIDSITFVNGNANGIARSLSDNCFIQFLLRQFVFLYEHATKPITLDHYRRLEVKIAENQLRIPGIFLYSRDDPISDAEQIDILVQKWSSYPDLLVHSKCWNRSAHCQHFKNHPEEYGSEIEKFLINLAKLRKVER